MNATEERQRLSRKAQEYAQSFGWEKIAEAHVQLYEELRAGLGGP
jgi:glycosyltransferase involved in cell wall biosynthesis